MSCCNLKRWFTPRCCCLDDPGKKEAKKLGEAKRNNHVAIHDLTGATNRNKNGNGVPPPSSGQLNPAFFHDHDPQLQVKIANAKPPGICDVTTTTRRDDIGYQQQMSDVSQVYRRPVSEGKSLSDLVFEELDKSMKSHEFDQSYFNDAFDPEDDDVIDDVTAEDVVGNEVVADGEVTKNDDVTAENDVTTPADVVPSGDKSTVWRDRLQQDLMNDDFELDQSFSSTSSRHDDDVTPDRVDDVITDDVDVCEKDGDAASSTADSCDDVSDASEHDDDVTSENDVFACRIPTAPDTSDDVMKGAENGVMTSSSDRLSDLRTLVIDNGSWEVRSGLSGGFVPEDTTRNVIGRWRAEASDAWREAIGSQFFGDVAIQRHSTLTLDYPVQDGRVMDWRGLQDLWNHVIAATETDVTSHPVLVSEPVDVGQKQREKMLEVLIESIRTPGVALRSQALLSLHAEQLSTAIVVNCGHGSTEVAPVYQGYQLNYATNKLPIGGRHVTEYLARLTNHERGLNFTSVAELELLNSIKESHAYVIEKEERKGRLAVEEVEELMLPDGREIELGRELFECAETYFQPALVGSTSPGLHHLVKRTVDRLDPQVLAKSDHVVMLTGAASKLDGLAARLQTELDHLGLERLSVRTAACGANGAWIGGSLLSNTDIVMIDENSYFEHGPQIVHRLF